MARMLQVLGEDVEMRLEKQTIDDFSSLNHKVDSRAHGSVHADI